MRSLRAMIRKEFIHLRRNPKRGRLQQSDCRSPWCFCSVTRCASRWIAAGRGPRPRADFLQHLGHRPAAVWDAPTDRGAFGGADSGQATDGRGTDGVITPKAFSDNTVGVKVDVNRREPGIARARGLCDTALSLKIAAGEHLTWQRHSILDIHQLER